MNTYKSLFTLFTVNYMIFYGFLFGFQDYFLYHPTAELKNHGLISKDFKTEEGIEIKVFILNPGHENAVLYFGGNAEPVGYNASHFKMALPDHTVYLVNYRGYGGSDGRPSEASLYKDSVIIFDELKQQHADIAVIGRSLGTGIATFLAAERTVNRMVLITPFDSIENVAQDKFPFFPISWILKDKYDSVSRVENIKADVLILLAENDQVIESWSSENLIAVFPENQISVHVMNDTDHNSISQHAEYYRLISDFLTAGL